MTTKSPLLPSQRVVQICLFLAATISMIGGPLQMYLGEPETTQRLDNVHRFMAGIYLGGGFIALWSGITIRQHRTLPFILALSPFLGGLGRVVSILHVGLPSPAGVWIGYLVPELTLPVIIVIAQLVTIKRLGHATPQGDGPRTAWAVSGAAD